MDNRLQEALNLVKQDLPLNDCPDLQREVYQTLISLAEQTIAWQKKMPKYIDYDTVEFAYKDGYNQALDAYTHALIQKLDVEKIALLIISHCRKYSKTPDEPTDMPLCIVKNARDLALSIKEYLTKEAV